jgi:hypothetical protein
MANKNTRADAEVGMTESLTQLALKIEHATTASRELDAEIMFDLYAQPMGKSYIDGGPTGYIWPEDDLCWSFGIRFPGKDRQWLVDTRMPVAGEKLIIERDGAVVLMNTQRIPPVTSSIDAALKLVPEGWYWRCGRTPIYAGWAYIHRTHLSNCDRNDEFGGGKEYWRGEWSPALALCYAAVQAQAALRTVVEREDGNG